MTDYNNNSEILRKIELDRFSNRIAFDMGVKIIDLAKSRNQHIAVEVCRLNQTVFLYVEMIHFRWTSIIG